MYFSVILNRAALKGNPYAAPQKCPMILLRRVMATLIRQGGQEHFFQDRLPSPCMGAVEQVINAAAVALAEYAQIGYRLFRLYGAPLLSCFIFFYA